MADSIMEMAQRHPDPLEAAASAAQTGALAEEAVGIGVEAASAVETGAGAVAAAGTGVVAASAAVTAVAVVEAGAVAASAVVSADRSLQSAWF